MKIGNFDLNKDGVFIIAELSANHNGSLQTALDTIKAAKECGANAIKLQTYRADTLTLNCKNRDFMIEGGTLWDGKSLYELYEEAYTPWKWHEELFAYARSLDLDVFSTPFDKSAVDFLETFNPTAYKIASFEITDYALVEYTASKGKPIIISTGIATLEEIIDVIALCRNVGNDQIILLKCTSSYPAALEEANLNTITNMKEKFGVNIGFSDHTLGITAPIVAVTLGACVIEKHFILDKSIGGADCAFSLDKQEFALMVQAVRETEKLLGNIDYSLNEKRKNQRRFCRSIYVSKNIKKGEIFSRENLKSVRPGYSMHPKYLDKLLGQKAKKDYHLGDRVEEYPHSM